MISLQGTLPVLRYIETKEHDVEGETEYQIDSSSQHRFGICTQSDLSASIGQSGEEALEVLVGELFYIPAGLTFSLIPSSSSGTKVTFIVFDAGKEYKPFGLLPTGLQSFRMPQMKNWLAEFIHHDQDSPLSEYFQLQSRLYALASAFMKALQQPPSREEAALTNYVEHTRRHILNNYDSVLDMEALARNSGSGSSRFYRTFRKHTGLSPHKFVTTTRLSASLRLLADSNVSVMEAAHSIGYSDEFYFSRLFKKQMGITPTEFATRAQVSIASLSPIFSGDLAVLGLTPRISLKKDWDLETEHLDRYLQEIRLCQPDHILTGPLSDYLLDALRQIAPVSVYHWFQYSWRQRLVEFGQLLGLERLAERWLADFNRKIANAQQHVAEKYPLAPYLIVGVREGILRLHGKQIRKFTDLFYDELQFKPSVGAGSYGFKDMISLQELSDMDSDHVLFIIEYPASEAYCLQLEAQWKQLPSNQRAGERRCMFIYLGEPFLYNAAMHEALVDQTVNQLLTK
ncbi:AraC family transcriptional regulator [Paenibacillus qinlingensis]|uniref:AraC family transcriptional regulator n=1 Tax=Paenibacillus qinlingensis TaxID=1837343 RepID=UPI0015668AD3|nr:AraC family transcriptional regulator [Paenibacillus qinlingensis]NQX63472.1 AraC family transcriptional regulator [Paenibacillus qinlingensis]